MDNLNEIKFQTLWGCGYYTLLDNMIIMINWSSFAVKTEETCSLNDT